jgi:amidase
MDERTIPQLQDKISSGEMTAVDITQMYLERIERIDQHGPSLNAIIELNPDAISIARAMDVERKKGQVRGPLHGIPILIKDNIDTHDRMTTTAGSLALEGSIAPRDAFLVERLRQVGAIILGKTNLSEWANFRSTHSSSGWSSRGGQTKNPYAIDRSPCGSSSGSGAATAANLCAAAIGTETDGSIICPAQTNGIVGIKPTLGLISRSGIIPIAHSQDTAGPMARTVTGAAILLGALTGIDPRDPETRFSRGKALSDYTPFLEIGGLKGARIGVARNCFGDDLRVTKIIENCLSLMKQAGAELIDPANLDNEEKFTKSELAVLHYEFKADLNTYLKTANSEGQVHSLQEIIAFNEAHKEHVMPYFGQERMLAAQKKGPLTSKGYLNALAKNHRLTREEGIDAVLEKYKLDAIVCPSGGPAWLIDLINGDHYQGCGTSSPAVAGYPCITVPAGYIFGLPIGITFMASAWQEPTLIRLAYAFEQATAIRRPPQLLPTADLMQ